MIIKAKKKNGTEKVNIFLFPLAIYFDIKTRRKNDDNSEQQLQQ